MKSLVERAVELANEWAMQYVEADTAPCTVGDYIGKELPTNGTEPCDGCNTAPMHCLGLLECHTALRAENEDLKSRNQELERQNEVMRGALEPFAVAASSATDPAPKQEVCEWENIGNGAWWKMECVGNSTVDPALLTLCPGCGRSIKLKEVESE